MLKFSFLVPIYNGEKYIERLFTSLLNQDIPLSEYEILCVDDCSTDSSVKNIRQYQEKFSNIRLFRNKHNCRVATNVNNLISKANGKYFWIIGQDDFIERNCLKRIFQKLENESLEVLLFNYRCVQENESIISDLRVVNVTNTLKGIDWIKNEFTERDYCQYLLGYEWRAVYRRDFWLKKNIRCVEGMNYEDTIIMLKAIVYANTVASIDDILYNYRINDSSITYSINHVKRGDLIYEFAFVVGQEVEDFYDELKKKDVSLSENLHAHLIERYNSFWLDIIRTPNEHKRSFYKCVEENRDFITSKRGYLNWKSRLLTTKILGYPIACVCYYAYRQCKKIKCSLQCI